MDFRLISNDMRILGPYKLITKLGAYSNIDAPLQNIHIIPDKITFIDNDGNSVSVDKFLFEKDLLFYLENFFSYLYYDIQNCSRIDDSNIDSAIKKVNKYLNDGTLSLDKYIIVRFKCSILDLNAESFSGAKPATISANLSYPSRPRYYQMTSKRFLEVLMVIKTDIKKYMDIAYDIFSDYFVDKKDRFLNKDEIIKRIEDISRRSDIPEKKKLPEISDENQYIETQVKTYNDPFGIHSVSDIKIQPKKEENIMFNLREIYAEIDQLDTKTYTFIDKLNLQKNEIVNVLDETGEIFHDFLYNVIHNIIEVRLEKHHKLYEINLKDLKFSYSKEDMNRLEYEYEYINKKIDEINTEIRLESVSLDTIIILKMSKFIQMPARFYIKYLESLKTTIESKVDPDIEDVVAEAREKSGFFRKYKNSLVALLIILVFILVIGFSILSMYVAISVFYSIRWKSGTGFGWPYYTVKYSILTAKERYFAKEQ